MLREGFCLLLVRVILALYKGEMYTVAKTLIKVQRCIANTSRFLLTGYIGLIWHSNAEATASWSIVEITLRVCFSYCMHGTYVIVTAVFPKSTLSGTPTCSSLGGTVSYKTFMAGQRYLDVFLQCCSAHTQDCVCESFHLSQQVFSPEHSVPWLGATA